MQVSKYNKIFYQIFVPFINSFIKEITNNSLFFDKEIQIQNKNLSLYPEKYQLHDIIEYNDYDIEFLHNPISNINANTYTNFCYSSYDDFFNRCPV